MILDVPPPLVAAEVDLQDFPDMMVDARLLRDSRFAAEVQAESFRAGVLLWCAAWHQVPAGSLPDNDIELSQLAGFGRVLKEWGKVKGEALWLFVRCSDGRLYHRVIAEKANKAWESRLQHFYGRAKERLRKANKARKEAAQPELAELTFEQWNAARLATGIPKEKAEAFAGTPPEDASDSAGIPSENALKGKRREREGKALLDTPPDGGEAPPPAPPAILKVVKTGSAPCPHQEIIALFVEALPRGVEPTQWTAGRQATLRIRWAKYPDLAWWRGFFAHCAKSPFLRGECEPGPGRTKRFRVNLPWLLKEENFAKACDGIWHDGAQA